MPAYILEHFARSAEPYERETRPDGYIPLCIAENALVWDLLEPRVTAPRDVPASAFGYDDMTGPLWFREALAGFLGRWMLGRPVSPEHLAVLGGAGSVLELLFYALADAGEGVLVPTPSYAGFWMDLGLRDGLTLVPVPGRADLGFQITPEDLDAAMDASEVPIRALLFTSPNNPIGTVYTPAELEAILRWGEERGVHVVFDEIYALSVFGPQAFTSVASLRPTLGEHVHIVWAFSKDFAASGLRCGVLISENAGVRAVVSSLSYWACCSGDTLHLLASLITDEAWAASYVEGMRERLGRACATVCDRLDAHGVPYVPGGAGFFVLVDLSSWLAEPTWEAEAALWRALLDRGNLNLTPGSALRAERPGLFRLCFAGVPPEVLEVALARLVDVLEQLDGSAGA